jgi:hypothetical protein
MNSAAILHRSQGLFHSLNYDRHIERTQCDGLYEHQWEPLKPFHVVYGHSVLARCRQ